MADSLGEQLSALMDGELARDQVRFLLRGVEAQSDLARRWSNYQVISASLKREYVAVALPANFAESVMGRLDAEVPVIVAAPSRRVGLGALRWVGGGAIAAAVAVVALTVSRPIDHDGGPAIAVAEQVPQHQSSQRYLPLAQPAPNTNSPIFNYGAVQPASYELPNYYLPNGSEVAPERLEIQGNRAPYILRIQRLPMQDSPQSATPAQQ